jgi:DNA-binding PucR family transcriptional regulator
MLWARDAAPVGGLIELCRVWHRALSDAWLGYLAQVPPARAWDPSAVQAGVRFFFDYFAGVAALLATAYTLNIEAMRRARSQRQLHLVQDVLAGRASSAAGVPYDLSLVHTGFIAWGAGAAAVGRLMRAELGHTVLAIPASEDIVWGWVGSHAPLDRGLLRKLSRPLATAATSLAFGRAASGIEGFRLTHEQAREAQALALALDAAVTLYEDVALEALATADPERARRFVADELGPLAEPGARLERLRETLEAYFAASLNANSAGARLGVHDQTVSYRLRRIEELIGYPIYQRRAELELALRLGRVLG